MRTKLQQVLRRFPLYLYEYMDDIHSEQDFVRCHESISVNISAIDKLTKTDITLRNKEVVPVSKSRYIEVADSYMNYRF